MKPTLGSLFAGIGGIDLGFKRSGFETAWQVEKNAYCRRVLRKNFPYASRRVTDVRFAGRRNLRAVDVIAAGFPCQDISNAGKMEGISGKRSGLFYQAIRIIDELRPRCVLLENVAALLGRGMGEVLGELSRIGYDAEWQPVSACDVIETDHFRKRIWILAYPNGDRLQKRADEPRHRDSADARKFSRGTGFGGIAEKDDSYTQRWQRPLGWQVRRAWWVGEPIQRDGDWQITHKPVLGRREDGLPYRLDQLRGLGNSVVPQIPEQIASHIARILAAAHREGERA